MKENADRARGLDAAELSKELREAGEQIFRLRFQLTMGQTDGLKKLRSLRKERARLLTVQRERELDRVPAPHHVGSAASAAAPVAKSAPKAAAAKPEAKSAGKAKPAA